MNPLLRQGVLSYRSPARRHYKTQNIYAVDGDGNRLLVHDPAMTEAIHRRIEKAVTSVAVDGQVVLDFDGAIAGDWIGVRGLRVTPSSESA